MELQQAIKKAFDDFGYKVVTESRFINILNDYGAFQDDKASMFVIQTLIKERILIRVCEDISSNSYINSSNVLVSKFANRLLQIYPYREDIVYDVLTIIIDQLVQGDLDSSYLKFSDGKLIVIGCKKEASGEIIIPSYVRIIREYAFFGCDKIKKITIQEGVKVIEDNAFFGCSSLEALSLPNSVVSIGSRNFFRKELCSISVNSNNPFDIYVGACFGLDVDKKKCVLSIPLYSSFLYRQHPVFEKFTNIQEKKELLGIKNDKQECNFSDSNEFTINADVFDIKNYVLYNCDKRVRGCVVVPQNTKKNRESCI